MIHANMLLKEIPILMAISNLIGTYLTKRKDKSAKIKYNVALSLTLMY